MNPLLLVLNPRNIPPCVQAIETLPIQQAWLTGYTERQLATHIPELVRATGHTHYLIISDDCQPEPHALHAVLHHLGQHPVVTGYCNLDETLPLVNLSTLPPTNEPPTAGDYRFLTNTDIKNAPALIPTKFAGFCLTGMNRELWQDFPFDCYGTPGYASDYNLSRRLHHAGIPIVAPKAARVLHHKTAWNHRDTHPDRQPVLGQPAITFKGGRQTA